MASLRLAIKASLEQSQAVAASAASPEPEAPSKAIKQDKALPAAKSSPTAPQRKRGKEATTPVAPPPKRSKPKASAASKAAKAAPTPPRTSKDAPTPAAPRKRSPPAAAPAPRKRDKKLDIKVGDQVDALWPADGEYYPAKVRAVNADGTIALDYADGDRRNDATTSELRRRRPAAEAVPKAEAPAKADPDFDPAAVPEAAGRTISKITDKKALEARMAADGWTKEEKPRESSSHVDKYWVDPKDGKKCRSIVEVARKAYPAFLIESTANAPKRPKKEPSSGPLACRKGCGRCFGNSGARGSHELHCDGTPKPPRRRRPSTITPAKRDKLPARRATNTDALKASAIDAAAPLPPPPPRERAKNHDIDLGRYGWTPPPEAPSFERTYTLLKAVEVPRTHSRENITLPEDEASGVRSACVGLVGARSHGVVASQFARSRPSLTRELVRFGRHFLPSSFKFTSIQLNHNFASALHVDDYNSGPSYIVGLGTYEGGELWTLEHGPLNCHHSFCHYDGTEPHATLPFTGERYTLVFFTHQTHPRLGDADRAYLEGLGFPLPKPTELLRRRQKKGFAHGTSFEAPKRVKTAAGQAAFDAHKAGLSVEEARQRGDAVFEAWRKEDAREATPEQRSIQGRVFVDDGTRWRVRDEKKRGVYYDLELKQLCVEYYDFDAYGMADPGSGDDVVEFTPYDELLGFADWVDAPDALSGEALEAARAEAARRLDAKRAFEAADDAMDYYAEKDRREAAAAAKSAMEAPFQPVLVQFDQR